MSLYSIVMTHLEPVPRLCCGKLLHSPQPSAQPKFQRIPSSKVMAGCSMQENNQMAGCWMPVRKMMTATSQLSNIQMLHFTFCSQAFHQNSTGYCPCLVLWISSLDIYTQCATVASTKKSLKNLFLEKIIIPPRKSIPFNVIKRVQ